jgi:hypothetical protein
MKSGLTESIQPSTEDALIVQQLLKSTGMTSSEALEKGLVNDRGVYFDKTGEEIKTAIANKIAALRAILERDREDFNARIAPTETPSAIAGIVPEPVPEPAFKFKFEDSWDYKGRMATITDLEATARNIDPKKTFRLCGHDLSSYGL